MHNNNNNLFEIVKSQINCYYYGLTINKNSKPK
jgi:hypothetical protein